MTAVLGAGLPLNKVHAVKTVDRLHDLAIGMEPEDGVIWVHGAADVEILAFTPFGVESLRDMIASQRGRHT